MKTIVVCSGGLDSVSLAHNIAAKGELMGLISFDYGQRHKKELEFAAAAAERLGVFHQIIDMRAIGSQLTGSALTDDVDVPDGHYAEETMRITVVPNRNAIMLTIAFGVAAARQADAVAIAVHGGDHFIYPDCRPGFIDSFDTMQRHALDGYASVKLLAPYVTGSKADIVTDGARHGTPFVETWSCYKGGTRHCGRCGTCVERREAFHLAGVTDPTDYEDPVFWKAVTEGFKAPEFKAQEVR
ncbi:7-cyano-7-deazaguanine synthase QueC [Aliirhizobium cellulosilyticum]|uniref:7-cyano-7-deazaguanine synthase n=1 Tax=Aliirhizobium cellulosilyticum TaxID=393664 RepID=A0A7W6TDU8_9HYPH|nr:7-cyano-7-deazaguanine synthase QueC [Rhizobium cellulosilyticum]MBB4346763.1 7-cyano-7-deazaguanine synthase [Rhizobium cellulosilyticum]MBB4410843.1 7-cyano-7-deazaguanine synthase [Rhizobium cellulosilyticum]MBB4445531.1 7-cyano-7-deazaguanine synthase [Rhizobium cellulosilyticum]